MSVRSQIVIALTFVLLLAAFVFSLLAPPAVRNLAWWPLLSLGVLGELLAWYRTRRISNWRYLEVAIIGVVVIAKLATYAGSFLRF